MSSPAALVLLLAGALTALASAAHLACIVFGAPAFRFMGASERMARAVEAGKVRPLLATVVIAAVLAISAAYAWSAAGFIAPLPFARLVLPAVAAVFVARGFATVWLRPMFPENSHTFWRVSSSACLCIGSLYATGTAGRWAWL